VLLSQAELQSLSQSSRHKKGESLTRLFLYPH